MLGVEKKQGSLWMRYGLCFALAVGLCLPQSAWAEAQDSADFASLVRLRPALGQCLEIKESGDERPLTVGDSLPISSHVQTDGATWAQLLILPELSLWIAPDSNVELRQLRPERSVVGLLEGYIRLSLGHLGFGDREVEVETDTVLAAVRGTDFSMARRGDGRVEIYVFEGHVSLKHRDGRLFDLRDGQGLSFEPGGVVNPFTPATGVAEAAPPTQKERANKAWTAGPKPSPMGPITDLNHWPYQGLGQGYWTVQITPPGRGE